MKVRRATIEDAFLVGTLGHRFIMAAKMPPATVDECITFSIELLKSENAGVFISAQGVIAGVVAPLYYRKDYLQAVELFWWAEDHSGGRLLVAFELWCAAKGVSDINMSTLDHYTPPGVEDHLLRRGYVLRDKVYRRELKP